MIGQRIMTGAIVDHAFHWAVADDEPEDSPSNSKDGES